MFLVLFVRRYWSVFIFGLYGYLRKIEVVVCFVVVKLIINLIIILFYFIWFVFSLFCLLSFNIVLKLLRVKFVEYICIIIWGNIRMFI